MGPVSAAELGYRVQDESALRFGLLPEMVRSRDERFNEQLLRSYASTYLKEEVQAEALVRQLAGFARFMQVAAETSGQFVDLSKMARRAKIPRQSAVRHFEILEDTLLLYRIEADPRVDGVDLVKHPRFFFFDVGVLNGLLKNFTVSADRIGNLFEHLFVSQIFASCFAKNIEPDVRNFRTRGGLEVDFIVTIGKDSHAIEVKAGSGISESDCYSLKQIRRYYGEKIGRFIAYRGTVEQKVDGVWVLPWVRVLREIGL